MSDANTGQSQRDELLAQLRQVIRELRQLGPIYDLPEWVQEEVWHLHDVEKRHPEYHYLECVLCGGEHGIAIKVTVDNNVNFPVVFEPYTHRMHLTWKQRLLRAWDALMGRPYYDDVPLDWPALVRLRAFLERVLWDAPPEAIAWHTNCKCAVESNE